MRIQIITDPEYFTNFSGWQEKISGVEFVGENPDLILDLAFLFPEQKLERLSKLDVGRATLVTNTLTVSASSAASVLPAPMAIIGAPILPGYFDAQALIEFSLPLNAKIGADQAYEFFKAIGKEGEEIEDCVAGVFPRSLSMIINEAAFALQEKVATAADIDQAMKLGTNYPKGPLAFCDEIGAQAVVAILDALAKEYGHDRYRVAPLLRRYAEADTKFHAV